VAKSLEGDYRPEHLFTLQQSLVGYRFYQKLLFEVDQELELKRAKGTRAKIRNIMSALFTHAMRYEWVDRNPIKLVRQSEAGAHP
jgi:hypothetical protein